MIILVVNITALFQLSEHSVGSSSNVIQDFLFSYLQSYSDSEFPPQFKCRDVSTLQEIVFDMDTPSLLSPNKEILFRVKYFDKVDAVCLYDDGDVFSTAQCHPWDAKFYNLRLLIRMCLRTSKSVLSLGFSTILYSYMATLEGSPFRHSCVLNTYSSAKEDEEESDASLQTLSTLERYYEGHTGGWIHSETGDIFAYDPALKLWTSLGNLGMRLPTRSNGSTWGTTMTVSAIINSSFQHLLAKIPKSFTIERSHGWEINQGGALEQLGFEVLLKDVHSLTPVAFCRDHSLLLTVSLTENRPTKELERLLKNYLRLLTYERSKHSLAEIIFGTGSPALFPNSLHRPSPSSPGYPFFLPPCTNLCISSIVDAPGPIKILSSNGSPAAMKGLVKEKQPSVSAHFPTLRMTQNLCSSAQLPEAKSVQYRFLRPEMSRRKRLETFLAEKNFSVPLLNFSQFSAGDDKAVSHNPSANDSIGKVSLFSVDEPCALIQTAAPTERSIEICNPATDNDVQSLQSVYSRPSQDRCDDLLLANISPMGNRPRTKQRPVSASMLRAKLPIRHPLCHKSREDFEVVVSPAKQIRPYSAHSKYQRQQQARKTGKEEKYLPMFAPPPPKEAFVGPPFLRHFGKLRDLIGRKYAGLGPQQRPGPGDMIHGSSSNLNLEGPWKW